MWAPNVGSEGSITAVRKRMASRRPQANARVRSGRALVGVLGGSKSDFPVLEKAVAMLTQLGIPNELLVVSAHRTPDRLFAYAERAPSRGVEVIIAGAGGAAHLPGMLAAKTYLPVIGVPIPTEHLKGMDSLLSIVQMPRGVPVATVAIGGAENAGLLAAQILAGRYPDIRERLMIFRAEQTDTVMAQQPDFLRRRATKGRAASST
ncbi:N5-carboxyaminoimidazole ribonucleotide mutase [Nitrospira sp.]|nr:N5-carboxyaminoimidazole ribonucleotide mutase [Nitrospira sp.]